MKKLFIKIKWWWQRNDIVYVFGFDGPRGLPCRKVRPKNWWEQPTYRKL